MSTTPSILSCKAYSPDDFSTLNEESTGLVSKKTLQRRHPDMIWSADTIKGERVLFLLEFQRTVERLMALRTTTYTALTLEGVAAGPDFQPGDPLPEFVYLVLYHGDGPWTAPARVRALFQRSDPGRYRLVPWGEGTGDDRSRHDLTALVLGLARNLSPEDMATQLSALWRAVEMNGDPGLDSARMRHGRGVHRAVADDVTPYRPLHSTGALTTYGTSISSTTQV